MFSGVHFCVGLPVKYFIPVPFRDSAEDFLLKITFFFPSSCVCAVCVCVCGGVIVRNAVAFDGSDSFSDKAGKLVFLFYLLSSGTFLDHSMQGGRTENASQCETAHTSRPLQVSFQNK